MHCDHCGKNHEEKDLAYFGLFTGSRELETLLCDNCACVFVDVTERFTKREFKPEEKS